MKKIFMFSLIGFMIIGFNSVNATSLSQYLPGGKNYIDYDNVFVYGDQLELNDSIKVKADTDYTLSMPGTSIFNDTIVISIYGVDNYINGDISSDTNCVIDTYVTYCNFHTSSNEDKIWIEINTNPLTQYYDYYGVEGFQLEEGLFSTEYEAYIAPLVDTTDPLFGGTGLFVNSYQTPLELQTIIDNHITAVDDIDGDLSNSIIVEYDEYTGNETIVGEYSVLLSVKDSALNEAVFELVIVIKDEVNPVISGPSTINQQFLINDSLLSIISNNFVYYDEVDSNLAIEILIDNYTMNIGKIGTYDVLFRVVDNSLNYTEKAFSITIYDDTAPLLSSSQIYNSYLSSILTYDSIIDSLIYTDDYEVLSDITLNVLEDGYSGNESVVGTYFIEIELVDSSYNITNETLTINVIDDILPVISGPSSLSVSYSNSLNINEIIEMMNVSDNYDSLSNLDLVVVSDLFSSNNTNIGIFDIVFEVYDYSGNVASHTISINIIDDIAPVIYVDSYIVTINLGTSFSEEDAIMLLKSNDEINDEQYQITTLVNEYDGNELIVGSYIYKIRLTSSNGNYIDKEFVVKVVDLNEGNLLLNSLSYRNISVYSFSILFIIFVIIKKRK